MTRALVCLPVTAPASPPPAPRGGADWPAQVTDTIVGLVDTAKDKTTGPATSVARGLVNGTLAAIVGLAALVLALVLLVRGLDILAQVVLDLIGIEKAGRSVWIAHALTGLLMVVVGAWAWRKGTHPSATD